MFSVSDKEIQKRIKKGKQLIDRHEVIFFDVFNTLLARDCENPSDIFLLVEQRFNEIATFTPLRDFKHMRQDAQKICAEKILAPKLDEIYEQVPLSVDQKSKLKALEIEVEEELSTRKSTGYSLYQYAKSLGKKIIAVSDMYLGAAVIRKMLLSAGYEICSVIVSCDHRAEKYNGKLFQVAMNEYAVEKKQIVHFGDNIISDIIGAFRAGIACLWIPPENKLAYLKPCGDAFANHYLIPFIANRIALIENKSTALGYETCGPLIVGFCQWLHEVIKKEQYSKILFCARDVKQTYEVYKKMFPNDTNRISYFYISLKSLELPYRSATGADSSLEAKQQLEYLRTYLKQINCNGKVAIVDSGISGRTQKMLTEILFGQYNLTGLYMRISKRFYQNVDVSKAFVFLFDKSPDVRNYICAGFFETMIAATHGRTISYTKNENGVVLPVLGQPNPKAEVVGGFQTGVELFANDFIKSSIGNYLIDADIVQNAFLNFAFYPKLKDVQILINVSGGDDIYSKIVIQRQKNHYLSHFLDFFKDLQNTYWKGGFIRYYFPIFSTLISYIYLQVDYVMLEWLGTKNGRTDTSWK